MLNQQQREQLVALLGCEKVSFEESVLLEHASDKWNASSVPEVVVFAESSSDVSACVKFAAQHQIPLTTRGAGVGYVGGCVAVKGGIVLSVMRMNRILEVNPLDGVVVAQPGVITKEIADAAAAIGWFYPPDPASLKECSIGGNIATNAGGPRCLKYGVTRSYVLGLEVVLANGDIVKCGGRVHKNKTGFDLVGLFCGSEGLLGIVTEATLRIIPHPKTRGMLSATFPDFRDAAAAVNAILDNGHLPSALEITDSYTLSAARAYLGEDALPQGNAHLIVEVDGSQASVANELDELSSILAACKAVEVRRADDGAACEQIWQLRREFSYSLRNTGLTKLNEDIVVPRSKLVELVDFCRGLQQQSGIDIACFGHAGDGNIHTNLMLGDYHQQGRKQQADEALDALFAWVIANKGAITGEHGVGMAKTRWLQQALGANNLQLHATIKKALDPSGILNPGKLGL